MLGTAVSAAEHLWLGIDFGTSTSSVARLIKGAPQAVLERTLRRPDFPSCILLQQQSAATAAGIEERLRLGVAAQNMRMRFPMRFRDNFKRSLGEEAVGDDGVARRVPLRIGDEYLPVELAVTALVRAMKAEADQAVTTPYVGAVVTVPVDYGELRLSLMNEAVRAAGFAEVVTLREPEAAAFFDAHNRAAGPTMGEETVLVYDFGGGTFDAALVLVEHPAPGSIGEPRCVTRGFRGLGDCGGVDIDHAIVARLTQLVDDDLRAALSTPPSRLPDAARRQALLTQMMVLDQARSIKHELSNIPDAAETTVDLGTPPRPIAFTRADFDSIVSGPVDRTIECCDELVTKAGSGWDAVDTILLIGGSSRLPLVTERLRRFGRPIRFATEPELAVVLGAALFTRTVVESRTKTRVAALHVVDPAAGPFRSIQAAVDAAAAGDIVSVVPGEYRETIQLVKAVTVVGAGEASAVVVKPKRGIPLTIRETAGRVSGLTLDACDADFAVLLTSSDAVVEKCLINGGSATSVMASGGAPTLRENRMSAVTSRAVLVNGAAKATVEFNEIDGAGGDAIAVGGTQTRATILQNVVRAAQGAGIRVDGGADASLTNNDIERCSAGGVVVSGAASSAGVRDNRIDGCPDAAIVVQDGASASVARNHVEGNACGIVVDGLGTRTNVEKNVIRASTAHGVVVRNGASATVAENEVAAPLLNGIDVEGERSTAVVRANHIRNSKETGILARAGADVFATGNTLTSNSVGIGADDHGTVLRIEDNVIDASSQSGVSLSNGAYGTVSKNDIGGSRTGVRLAGSGGEVAVRANRIHDGSFVGVHVTAGAYALVSENDVTAHTAGVVAEDGGTRVTVDGNTIRDGSSSAVRVICGASASVTNNLIERHAAAAILVDGATSIAIVRENRVREGKDAGIYVVDQGCASISRNVFTGNAVGILVLNAGTCATVEQNEILACTSYGIGAEEGAEVTLTGNEIAQCAGDGITMKDAGTTGTIEGNHVHDGKDAAVFVYGGASASVAHNRLFDNLYGVYAKDAETEVKAARNIVEGGRSGIVVEGARATLEANDIAKSELAGIAVFAVTSVVNASSNRLHNGSGSGALLHSAKRVHFKNNEVSANDVGVNFADGTIAELGVADNRLWGNASGAFALIGSLSGQMGRNDLGLREHTDAALAELARLLEVYDLPAADAETRRLIKAWAGNQRIVDDLTARRLPAASLRSMDTVWRVTTGGGLLARPWCKFNKYDLSSWSWGIWDTWLRKRLRDVGCT